MVLEIEIALGEKIQETSCNLWQNGNVRGERDQQLRSGPVGQM